MVKAFEEFVLATRIISSAKNRYEKPGPFLETFTGFHNLSSREDWIKKSRNSIQIMNKYGEIGSLCVKPLDGLNDLIFPPLKRIEIFEEVIQHRINMIRWLGKLNYCIMNSINFHSNLSKAFAKSIFKIMKPFFPFLCLA